MLLTLLAIIICSCEPIVVTPPVVQGLEGVYGTVYTINAEPIEGIMIEVYYDKRIQGLNIRDKVERDENGMPIQTQTAKQELPKTEDNKTE